MNTWNLNLTVRTTAALLMAGLLAGCATDRQAGRWHVFFKNNTEGWRGFRRTGFPTNGWVLEDGCLHLLPKSKGGNIVTIQKYTDFEFEWDWRIGLKGNNGVKYLVIEDADRRDKPGHEYQMVDDDAESDPIGRTAAFYNVLAAQANKPLKPPGEWNRSRLVVRGSHVEHWLNGVEVLAYELGSVEVMAAVANSKFKAVPGFGNKITGHLMLTDHNKETWFRNVRIRELPPK